MFVSVRARRTQRVSVFASGLLSLACTTPKRSSPQATAKRETNGGRELMEEAHKDSDRGGGERGGEPEGWTVKHCHKHSRTVALVKKFCQSVTM